MSNLCILLSLSFHFSVHESHLQRKSLTLTSLKQGTVKDAKQMHFTNKMTAIMEEDAEEMTSPSTTATNYRAINQVSSTAATITQNTLPNASKCHTFICARQIYKRHSFDDTILYCRKYSVKKDVTFDDIEVTRRKAFAPQNCAYTRLSQIHLLQDTELLDCLIESIKQKKQLDTQIDYLKSKMIHWKR